MTASIALTLGKSCAACGKERKTKYLRYDAETFKPYCENPYICNDLHPNSVKNLITNQTEIGLLTYEQASEGYKAYLMSSYNNGDVVSRIQAILTKPSNIRVQDPEMAKFLVEFQDEQGLKTLSETIRYCVQVVKDNKNQFNNEYRVEAENHRKEMVAANVVKDLQGDTKPVPAVATAPTNSDNFGEF